jgi:hypothetical protein
MSRSFVINTTINVDLDEEAQDRIRNQVDQIIQEELKKVKLPKPNRPTPTKEFVEWFGSAVVIRALDSTIKNMVRDELYNTGYYDMMDALRVAVEDVKNIKETFENFGGNL